MTMRYLALGVGDAFASRYYSTAIIVEAQGFRLLIDCPHPIRKMMRESEADLDVGDIDAVLLTHLHGDHVSGLEGFAWFNRFVVKRRTRLYAHPSVHGPLWDRHLKVSMGCLIDPEHSPMPAVEEADLFEIHDLDLDAPVRIGPFSVDCRMTIHHIPTTATRIKCAGRSLGYSGDTGFDPGLIEWLSGCDRILHETNYGAHTPYAKLAALPADLRAKMQLIHYPDDFDITASTITAADQGRWVEI